MHKLCQHVLTFLACYATGAVGGVHSWMHSKHPQLCLCIMPNRKCTRRRLLLEHHYVLSCAPEYTILHP